MTEILDLLTADIRNANSIEQRALAVQSYSQFVEANLIQEQYSDECGCVVSSVLTAEPLSEDEIDAKFARVFVDA